MTSGGFFDQGGRWIPQRYRQPSRKRFVVLGGPGGYLTCRPAGCPMITDQYKRWTVLFTVNRPYTFPLAEAAKGAALRCYELKAEAR